MIKETGKIISIEEQHGEKIAVIECISKSACSGCHNQDSCGVGTVAKSYSDKTHRFPVSYQQWMEVDESIELQIRNSDLVSSAIIAYLVPLVFFIGGAVVSKQFTLLHEGQIILAAVGCGMIGFAFTRLLSNKLFPKREFNEIISTQSKQ